MYAVFNSKTEQIISITPDKPKGNKGIKVVKLEEKFELGKDYVVGTLKDYKIVSTQENPVILQKKHLKEGSGIKIQELYPLHSQINILVREIKRISEESSLTLSREFLNMLTVIGSVVKGYEDRKESAEKDPYTIFIDFDGNEIGTHLDNSEALTKDELAEIENIAYLQHDEALFNSSRYSNTKILNKGRKLDLVEARRGKSKLDSVDKKK
jgi:hypothetical protein